MIAANLDPLYERFRHDNVHEAAGTVGVDQNLLRESDASAPCGSRSPARTCVALAGGGWSAGGTQILIDRPLKGARPHGSWSQPKSHNAGAAAVAQNRVDRGVTIDLPARSPYTVTPNRAPIIAQTMHEIG